MKEDERATKNKPETKPAQDEVAKKAYAIYLKEGRPQGRDLQNWLEAETNIPSAGSDHHADMAGEQSMKETTVQIDGMMSIFDGAGVEKQIKRRDGVVRVDANFLSGTATIVYDGTRVTPDDINRFIADCCYHCRGEVLPAHVCEPDKLKRTPTVPMEHQGHAVP